MRVVCGFVCVCVYVMFMSVWSLCEGRGLGSPIVIIISLI